MTSWYCAELWKLMVFASMMMLSGGFVFGGSTKVERWLTKVERWLIGLVIAGGAWLLILIPTTAGGGG